LTFVKGLGSCELKRGPAPGSPGTPAGSDGVKTLSAKDTINCPMERGEFEVSVNTVVVTRDGKLAAVHGDAKAKNLQIWDLGKRSLLHTFDAPAGVILPLALAPDGKLLAYPDTGVVLRNTQTGAVERTLRPKGYLGFCNDLYFSPTGNLLVAATDDY